MVCLGGERGWVIGGCDEQGLFLGFDDRVFLSGGIVSGWVSSPR